MVVEKMKAPDFFHEKVGQQIISGIDKLQLALCADTSDIQVWGAKMFLRIFY